MKRCLIELTPSKEDNEKSIKIDLNYNHALFSIILKLINYSDPELANEIHNRSGYKLFTFSRIFSKNSQVKDGQIILDRDHSRIKFYVSSVEDKIVEKIMVGAVSLVDIKFFDATFYTSYVKVIEPPEFLEKMKFKLLSPLILSKPREKNGKLYHEYLSPLHPEYADRFIDNLTKKYKYYYGKNPNPLKFTPDWDYINRKERISKLIKIKNVYVKGYIFPFELEGDKEAIKFGYYAGFGENTALGFGFSEIVKEGD